MQLEIELDAIINSEFVFSLSLFFPNIGHDFLQKCRVNKNTNNSFIDY